MLAAYLNGHPEIVNGKTVVELGGGQGLVGVCAAVLGASAVAITDLSYALPGIQETIELNREAFGGALVTAEELDWFAPPSTTAWDVVLAADVVWLLELVGPFVTTLAALCPPGSDRTVLLSYQRRGLDTDDELWRRLGTAGFDVEGPLDFDADNALVLSSEAAEIDADQTGFSSCAEIGLFSIRRCVP
jgi:hypothetical protein